MKKKSLISLLLVVAMLLGLLAGCGGDTASAPAEETASAPVPSAPARPMAVISQ